MIPIDALLTENDLADEFVSSFKARRLAEKFFYWFPLSVRAWLALCSDGAYRNFVRSRSLIASSADELAGLLAPGPLEVLSLGSGQGDKDLILLEALRARGARVSYVPVDTSQALLEMACGGALAARLPAHGIKADFTKREHLAALAPEPETPPRLVLLVGNTLGAFDPIAEARELAALLRPGDRLLVDGALAFEARDDPRLPGLHVIPKHFRASRPIEALMGGEVLRLEPGERLDMNHSYKYAADTLLGILADAGLAARWEARSDDQRFLMVLAGPG